MKDTTRENTKDNGGDKLDASRDDPLADYTPQQRRTIIEELRILVRVAIRSYMRGQAKQESLNSGSQLTAQNPGEGLLTHGGIETPGEYKHFLASGSRKRPASGHQQQAVGGAENIWQPTSPRSSPFCSGS